MAKNDSIKEIIIKSGNNFHYKVVEFLKTNGWDVLVSPYYCDNITNKSRELDIIAEKLIPVQDMGQFLGDIKIRIFVECKYIKNEVVFWFDDIDRKKAEEFFGLNAVNFGGNVPHYFINQQVAKIFSSSKTNQDNDVIFKSITQSLNGLIYYKNKNIFPKEYSAPLKKQINLPIIVCDKFDFYKVKKDDTYEEINDTFQIELNYSYLNENNKHETDYFLIDVINFRDLESFFDYLIREDIKIFINDILFKDHMKRK